MNEKIIVSLAIIGLLFVLVTKGRAPSAIVQASTGSFVPWYLTYNSSYANGFSGGTPVMPSNIAGIENYPGYSNGECSACSLFSTITSGRL